MSRMPDRKLLIALGALLLIVLVALVFASKAEAPAPAEEVSLEARREALPQNIELADTAEKRTLGLSGRASIGDDYGMLFIFPEEDRHGFWMKDMQVPIDIVWIDGEGAVVHIEHELSPLTYPKVFQSPAPARYVLETRAGYARDQGWGTGTLLDISAYD